MYTHARGTNAIDSTKVSLSEHPGCIRVIYMYTTKKRQRGLVAYKLSEAIAACLLPSSKSCHLYSLYIVRNSISNNQSWCYIHNTDEAYMQHKYNQLIMCGSQFVCTVCTW